MIIEGISERTALPFLWLLLVSSLLKTDPNLCCGQVHGPGMKGDNKNLVEQSSELRKLQEELKQSHKKSQGEFLSPGRPLG